MDMFSLPGLPMLPLAANPRDLAATPHPGDARAIEAAAVGFESVFASLLVKQMRQTLEPDTLFGQDQSDILGGLFDLTMGQHVAQAGALGIGKLLKQHWAQRVQS